MLICGRAQGDYNILTAVNGAEALDLLSKKDVDMITSDVMMPEMDGLELCRRVKTDINTSHIPVILLTAKSMAGDDCKAWRLVRMTISRNLSVWKYSGSASIN